MRKRLSRVFSLFLIIFLLVTPVLANKSATKIEGPEAVKKGDEIVLKIHVTHKGNNRFHYTRSLVVLANGKKIAGWDFSGSNLPESENFIREVKLVVNEDTEILAEAHCNLHGSTGPSSLKIKVE